MKEKQIIFSPIELAQLRMACRNYLFFLRDEISRANCAQDAIVARTKKEGIERVLEKLKM